MDIEAERAEVAANYLSTLSDLTSNSKLTINVLTMLAEESKDHGQIIVNTITQHISKVEPDAKLPVLYLIDSILKNVGDKGGCAYIKLFSHSIIPIFTGVFEKVNEEIRQRMFSLRHTWNEVFLPTKLYELDVSVNQIDPKWPIVQPRAAPSIHVNPNFLSLTSEQQLQAELKKKQQELMELKKQKLELAIRSTKQQMRQIEAELPKIEVLSNDSSVPVQLSIPPPRQTNVGNRIVVPPRPRIAPVNPALISTAKLRDPRLMRQPAVQQAQTLPTPPVNSIAAQTQPKANEPTSVVASGHVSGSVSGFSNSTNRAQRVHNSSSDSASGNDSSSRTSKSTHSTLSSHKSSSKSISKSNNSSSKMNNKPSSSSSTLSKRSSSKERSSRSSSSSHKKSKSRKDEKSPQRKKSSSRHRSPSSRRSSTPNNSQKSSRKSKSSDTSAISSSASHKHTKPNSINDNCNSTTSSKDKSSPTKSDRETVNSAFDRTQSPNLMNKDVDLRAQLVQPMDFPQNPLIGATVNDKEIIIPVSIANHSEAIDKKGDDNTPKDIDLRTELLPGITTNSTASIANDVKKRSPGDVAVEGPISKKSKSEKIDILFGTEDVDLRIPPMSQINSQSILSLPPQNTESTNSELKVDKEMINPLVQRVKMVDENSQDSNDKFKIILMQAKEQVENSDVNPDQIQSMVQQLMMAKSDSDARKSLKRNSTGNSTKAIDNEVSEIFSSDSGDETIKQSHRVPPKRRRQDDNKLSGNANVANNSNKSKSPIKENPASTAPKERRVRKTKWNSPWEERQPVLPMQTIPTNIMPHMNFPAIVPPSLPVNSSAGADGDTTHQFSSRNAPVWQQNFQPMNNPIMPNVTPPIAGGIGPQLVMAQHGSSLAHGTPERNINIDGIPRAIRFYEETAIAFMDGTGSRDPKEIGFQSGERRLCVNNKESIVLAFNDTYTPFVISGKQYQIRFGSPTRELYIDNEWYECYFGDPAVGIVLDGELHTFRVDGPPPQVRIGSMRNDLVVGKVDMYVDINTKVSLFLDSQEQIFHVNNKSHTIQFADYFLTVLIDNIPFSVQYGSMPAKYRLDNSDHYIRFSVLPNDIVAGKVFARNMRRTPLHRDLISPLPPIITAIPPAIGPIIPLMSIVPNPDLIANKKGPSNDTKSNATNSHVIAPSESSNSASALNINDLYQKLLATGILNNVKEVPKEKKERPSPIALNKPESLKRRQAAVVATLYSGMQCSSCGLRFPLEQTMKYSQHLDWHYRQNRRERDSARRAHSRKWYYGMSDWIQYEEIENVDEREKNFFEAQQNDDHSEYDDSNQQSTATPQPSCIAGPDDHNRTCDMCHDAFETFFHEETEDWHLRNAVRIEEKTFHPDCYDDFKDSLRAADATMTSSVGNTSADDNAVDMDVNDERTTNSIGIMSGEEKIPSLDDDDDDVIVVPQEEPVITEIADDEEPQTDKSAIAESNGLAESETQAETPDAGVDTELKSLQDSADNVEEGHEIHNESDVQILEPHISVLNLDDYVEKELPEPDESAAPIKIKEEPKYEGYADEEDAFEDVGTFEGEPIDLLDDGSDEYVPATVVHTQPTMVASMDGNVELQDTQPTTIGPNKIKINISKNVQLNKNSINSSETVDPNVAIDNKETHALNARDTDSVANNRTIITSGTDGCGNGNGSSDDATIVTDVSSSTTSTTQDNTGDKKNTANAKDADGSEIDFVVKESIRHVRFNRQPTVRSGLETSGLCSIM